MLSARHHREAPAPPVSKLPPLKIAQARAKRLPGRFTQVFFAVLFAGLLLILIIAGWISLDRWEQEKRRLLNYEAHVQKSIGDSPGQYASIATLDSHLERLRFAISETAESSAALLRLLDNKPFFLPLSPEERSLRQEIIQVYGDPAAR